MKASLLQILESNYTVEKEIGRGGMGVVYKALDKRLERPVAIKVLTLSGSEDPNDSVANEVIARFQREAKVVARLSHPNIVSIFDVGQDADQYYMVIEFAEGKPLDSLVKAKKPLPPALVTSIGIQLCSALEYAHENKIIHRDVKPANVILSPKGKARLTDFGIAQLGTESSKLTQAGSMMGGIMYASPEQIQDAGTVDYRTDLYSLGVTLYELYTGRTPYESESVSQLLLEILTATKTASPMNTFNPEIPDALELVIQKSLSKSVGDRYQNAAEFGQALSQMMGSSFKSQGTGNLTLNLDFQESNAKESVTQISGKSTILRRTRINQELHKGLLLNHQWIYQALQSWKKEAITTVNLKQVISKVTAPSLYGKAFSGALLIDEHIITFLYDGHFVGAINTQNGHCGNDVFRGLPDTPKTLELRVLGEEQAQEAILLSSAVSGSGQEIQKNLDSSLMDLVPLINNLSSDEEKFTGYIKCFSQHNLFYYGFIDGKQIFQGAATPPKEELSDSYLDLKKLVLNHGVLLNIYEPQFDLVGPSVRNLFQSAEITFSHQDPLKTSLRNIADYGAKEVPLHLIKEAKQNASVNIKLENTHPIDVLGQQFCLQTFTQSSVYFKFIEWYFNSYFYQLNSSGNTNTLKYIYDWIPATQEIKTFETLRGKDGKDYCFTLATHGQAPGDKSPKILSLIRFGAGSADLLETFIQDVKQVKSQLSKSGAIGGAIYVSHEEFNTEALKHFYSSTVEPRKGGLGALDKLTKYKGFVRMGMKRGFHLNLIETKSKTKGDHQFEVIAPLLK